MKLLQSSKREWIFAAALLLLATVCGVLAFLQYRWIGEVATAEQQRLRQELQRNLDFIRRDFNSQLAKASAGLVPSDKEVQQQGREKAYLLRFQNESEETQKYFRRVALAVPEDGELEFFLLDVRERMFHSADWPLGWAKLREGLSARRNGGAAGPEQYRPEGVIEFPRFGVGRGEPSREERPSEQEWLIVDFDRDFLRNSVLPSLLQKYLTADGQPQYTVNVTETSDPWQEVYRWGPRSLDTTARPDASVTLFEIESGPFRGGPPRNSGTLAAATSFPGPPSPGRGAWLLRANHPAGSLESIVAKARRRNLILAAGLLSLLIATMIALVRFTREAEKLAELQMNFVSGISHELRTPLSVIRAAGFNLRTKFSGQPQQVERYGQLIEGESQKLTTLIEQILRYGSAESGRVLGDREIVAVGPLIEESLPDTREALAKSGITVEERIEPELPPIRADRESVKHALQNLLENAVKHGNQEHAQIRITARRVSLVGTSAVRIGIQDNGPGIPSDERERVFEPFFRGRLAMENQVHGTGLGLNLAKRIVEAHGGTLILLSQEGHGTEFVVTFPAVAAE